MCLFSRCDLAICPRRNLGPMNLDRSENLTVADPDLQIRGGPAHPDPEVGGVGSVPIWSVWSKKECVCVCVCGGGGVGVGGWVLAAFP